MTDLEISRAQKDDFFGSHPQSPLTAEQRKKFDGLKYFPENSALRLEVLVDEFATKEKIVMQTTTGDERHYTRYGKFKFSVEGQEAELTIYESAHGFFLPFVDSLANKETYPAGRYLEPEQLDGRKFLVDFNIAYNPFCAYNDKWSCPLTPFENRLKVPIRAGEKLYSSEEMGGH